MLLQRDPLGIVRNPEALLTVFATVFAGMLIIKAASLFHSGRFMKYVQSHAGIGTRLIELFDAIGLAASLSWASWSRWTPPPNHSGCGGQ